MGDIYVSWTGLSVRKHRLRSKWLIQIHGRIHNGVITHKSVTWELGRMFPSWPFIQKGIRLFDGTSSAQRETGSSVVVWLINGGDQILG